MNDDFPVVAKSNWKTQTISSRATLVIKLYTVLDYLTQIAGVKFDLFILAAVRNNPKDPGPEATTCLAHLVYHDTVRHFRSGCHFSDMMMKSKKFKF